tara:strand:- start:102 stop:299 length:198 start_codon:yes stop_codon:yes gene_type:complete
MKTTKGQEMSNQQKIDIADAYASHDGKWPKQLNISGVMFWNGTRITKADFRAIKKDGIQSNRFSK